MALTRREFVLRSAAAAGAATQLQNLVQAQPQPATTTGPATAPSVPAGAVALSWLEGRPPATPTGVTWGVPWPRGACAKDQTFTLTSGSGAATPIQTWPLAFWPD